MESSAGPSVLHDWYNALPSRLVDLVGDYAGDELFMIEGDSLLLHCLQDPALDFHDGFQLLHAVYLVERFLHGLVLRKCKFDIVFFRENRELCVPFGTLPIDRPKYLLAREAVIQHLVGHQDLIRPVRIHRFNAITDLAFLKSLDDQGYYFVMCHDGAQAPARSSQDKRRQAQKVLVYTSENDTAPLRNVEKSILRGMAIDFMTRGMGVALMDGLEMQDTKVMVQILEGGRRPPEASQSDIGSEHVRARNVLKTRASTLQGQSAFDILLSIRERSGVACPELPKAEVDRNWLALKPSSSESSTNTFLALAFLLHIVLLDHIPASQRRIDTTKLKYGQMTDKDQIAKFLSVVTFDTAEAVGRLNWDVTERPMTDRDIADLVDGRLFEGCAHILAHKETIGRLPGVLQAKFRRYVDAANATAALDQLTEQHGIQKIAVPSVALDTRSARSSRQERLPLFPVLPFSNTAVDEHLASVRLAVDASTAEPEGTPAKIFQELSHWHNSKKPLARKPATAQEGRTRFWQLRSNQYFMASMTAYAASLTSSVGKALEPELIITSRSKDSKAEAKANAPSVNGSVPISLPARKQGTAKGRNTIRDEIVARKAKKDEESAEKTMSSWKVKRDSLDTIVDPTVRYTSTQTYLQELATTKRRVLEASILLYMLHILMGMWSKYCKAGKKEEGCPTAAMMCHALLQLAEGPPGMTESIAAEIGQIAIRLGVPLSEFKPRSSGSPFRFDLPSSGPLREAPSNDLLPMSWIEFQLLHYGPYMDRNVGSAPDPRVSFEPDAWQRKVLDELDAERSLFIVAPTSAGKTFISFYAMEQILRADDNGVLVYVAPTKALVNQVAAEIQARFQKNYQAGKTVWAIHTRDYRVNNPNGCQILVTVPHILQIMLLSPENARSWSPRVRRIIFDEIHCIGQADDGVVWEQLLLLAPCPIIALSATVGNPEEFNDWLKSTQEALGQTLTMITHEHRYSDLRKFTFQPPSQYTFSKLGERPAIGRLGLDGVPSFTFVHPMSSLTISARGMPNDLTLEPRDCYTLSQAMKRHWPAERSICDEVNEPARLLPTFIKKADIFQWENVLKAELRAWTCAYPAAFDSVVRELGGPPASPINPAIETARSNVADPPEPILLEREDEKLYHGTLPLLSTLHESGALPAILFSYDRGKCEGMAKTVLDQLTLAESIWKETDPSWRAMMMGWERWKTARAKKAPRTSSKKENKKEKGKSDEIRSKATSVMEAASAEADPYEFFDPDAPIDGFHFADKKRLQRAELEGHFHALRRIGLAEWLMQALTRGIGIHHAGMNRKYRQAVEMLFRKRFLRVVMATGTLALGINMPCATVVFSGDSIFLTALNFRQAAGRAGRRGFDLLGNVVFHHISYSRVCRLLSSRLPNLNGHFPLTTTLVLRLFSLLHNSNTSPYAINAVRSLLSQPRLYLGGQSFQDQVRHHLRFSIEYLRRQNLLGPKGAPLNFAGCVSHLYFTENSAFAFHALLRGGYFHRLCAGLQTAPIQCLQTLMIVMAHLFGRRRCRQVDQDFVERVIRRSPSLVYLPALPKPAAMMLRKHNEETQDIFTAYVQTFVAQHIQFEDDQLPFTKWRSTTATDTTSDVVSLPTLPPTKVRSPFVALSGQGDLFQSLTDLCSNVRGGVFLEKAAIPHLDIDPDDSSTPLNGYLYDFYKHGDLTALEKANGIRKSDVWFMLNDFSLVLATIVTSLANVMKLDPVNDLDILDVVGEGDKLDMAQDERLATDASASVSSEKLKSLDASTSQKDSDGPVQGAGLRQKGHVGAGRVVESWESEEDDLKEEEDEVKAKLGRTLSRLTVGKDGHGLDQWDDDDSESSTSTEDTPLSSEPGGLLNVLRAFEKLKAEFDEKFKAVWA